MKLLKNILYKREKRHLEISVEHEHEKYGPVVCEISVNFKGNTRMVRVSSHVIGVQIPHEEHIELVKEMRANVELKNFIFQEIENYMNDNEIQNKELEAESVFVLHAKTTYIREVVRKGRNLSDIEEVQKEEHTLIVAVKPKDLDSELHFCITYSKYGTYDIRPQREYEDMMKEYYSYNWEEKLLKQMLPMVKEKVHFLLP